jgi:hypothetical protein
MSIARDWKKVAAGPLNEWPLMGPEVAIHALADKERRVPGTTGFFRNKKLLDQLVLYLEQAEFLRDPRILCAPSSVGCEPYSVAMRLEEEGIFKKYPATKIYALEIQPDLLKIGMNAAYYNFFFHGMSKKRKNHFFESYTEQGTSFLRLKESIRNRVVFLPPQDLAKYRPGDMHYDITICFHLLQHVRETAERRRMLKSLFRMSQLTLMTGRSKGNLVLDMQAVVDGFRDKGVFAPVGLDMRPMEPLQLGTVLDKTVFPSLDVSPSKRAMPVTMVYRYS